MARMFSVKELYQAIHQIRQALGTGVRMILVQIRLSVCRPAEVTYCIRIGLS